MPAPTCVRCGQTGHGIQFPLFPITKGASFGDLCVTCDTNNPWNRPNLACVDCEMELTKETAYGNRKYGDPQCEDCFESQN